MSLDTYLPVGRGRYLIGSQPQSQGHLYYFMPERHDHLRVGFEVVRQDRYGSEDYADVVVNTPDNTPASVEEGEYSVKASFRGCRIVELRSVSGIRRIQALGQPGLGRFRFLSDDSRI